MIQKPTSQSFFDRLADRTAIVDAELDAILSVVKKPQEIERPAKLIEAMRYSVFNGGKRLRPFLVMETAKLFGVAPTKSARTAAAIECIHCYSLVHDDLPAMDNDDLRRGLPTTHKAYGEALGILAGDGLLTVAFEILANELTHPSAETRANLVLELSAASGLAGMVGGQHLDLAAEGATLSQQEILTMQSMKTGALIKAACSMGAILGNATPDNQILLNTFGQAIGQAFQLTDDILDVTSSTETLGKAAAKDQDRNKATLVAHLGLEQSEILAHKLIDQANQSLSSFGRKAHILKQTANFVIHRMS